MKLLGRLATIALVGVWFVLLRPVALGGPAGYEIVAGHSMEPLLHTGDLVVTQSQAVYHVGDLVVFRVPSGQLGAGSSVVHRIVGGDGTGGFTTKGDNNPSADPWHPRASDIIGRSWIQLPGSGAWLLVLRKPLVLAAILGGLFGFWFLTTDFKLPVRPGRTVRGFVLRSGDRVPEPVPEETAK
ncbi:MAG: signal peptidase I [Candidatus Limnocylindrales bacterium]